MNNVIQMPKKPPDKMRKECIFKNRPVQVLGESGRLELYPCIVLYESETDIPIFYTGLERYLCHLGKSQLLDSKTLSMRAYAVCHFLNYILWETNICMLHECTLKTIREYLKTSRKKANGDSYKKETWYRNRNFLTDFLILYYEYNKECLSFKYSSNDLRQQGLQQKLVELVEKKLAKGYSIAEIADMLEESEETIKKIIGELHK